MDMLLFLRTLCRTAARNRVAGLIAFLLVGWSTGAHAFWSLGLIPGVYIPQTYYKHGAVYTRAIVLSPAGNPYYVEYDDSGNEGREIAEKTGEYERAQIMAGAYYRSLLQRLTDAKTRYPEHEELSAADYRGSTFKTAGGEPIQKPSIAPDTLTVLVRAENNRYLKDGSDLLLLELPIKASVQPSASSQSILLSEAGDILHQTANTIAFRVGFFGKDGKVATNLRRDHDSDIYGKMPSVPVSLGGHIAGGFAITDTDGKYRMNYFLPACPGFTFDYTTPVYLELYYSRFNPRGSSMMPYYLVRQDYDFCNGLGVYSMGAAMVIATMATPVKPKFDFPVDLMVVDGAAAFTDVKLGDKTAYNPETSDYAKTVQDAYDFDGDEKPEIIVPGKRVKKTIDGQEREVFVETAVAEAELQGIYLSSRHSGKPASTEETAPDFTRLIDTTADFKDRGLLQSISKDDLRDTDIYVFRESTGQLVAERRGLHENELYKTFSGVDDKQGSFRFTIQLRGAVENHFALAGRNGEANFTKWQSAGGFTEAFQKRTGNHLKSGEQVRIIAINRPTGYMGSARINLNAALNGNMIDLNQARIQLTPPNLKIWAERKNKIERGMTRGEEKKQLIGNEGAGLGSDISIAIYSEWRDQDGGPLPEALADYGYTGRLAKIVAANQLAPVGANNLSQFKIKPGQQVQVIQLPEKVLAKQHLYLQVAGQPENRNPDFATGNGEGILKYRPSKYVPVQVPLHDEEASEIARQAYRKADKEKPELNLKKPEPMYSWQYRPEMQFSLYELNIKEIRKVDARNLIDQAYVDNKPTLASTDKLLEVYYDLLKSQFGELQAWSYEGEKQLVLAFGEQEIEATFGEDQTIRFENLEHLGLLDVDDFLSIRLYSNSDQGNTLLEWAFEYLSVFANEDESFNEDSKYIFVSADDPKVEMKAVLAGYYHRREEIKKPETVRWAVEGGGSVSPAINTSMDTGIFSTILTMPTSAGSKGIVNAALQGGDAKAYFKEVYVIPGAPANISATFTGQLYAGNVGELEASVRVTDRHGNIMPSGVGVDFYVEGEGVLSTDSEALFGGLAKVKIHRASRPGDNNYLVVKINDLVQRFPFSVKSFQATPELPEEVYENQIVDLKISLSGIPAEEIKAKTIKVSVDKGLIIDQVGRIDADGNLIYRWHTGHVPGDANVFFGLGDGTRGSKGYRVLPDPESLVVNKKPVFLVAGAEDDVIAYSRANGQNISIPILRQDKITLKGKPGENITIRLGDALSPNRQSLTTLRPGNLERSRFLSQGQLIAKAPGFRHKLSTVDGRPVAFNYKGYALTLVESAKLIEAVQRNDLRLAMEFEGENDGILLSWQDLLSFNIHQGKLQVTRKLSDGGQEIFQEHVLTSSSDIHLLQLNSEGGAFHYSLDDIQGVVSPVDGVIAQNDSKISLLGWKGANLRHFSAVSQSAAPLVNLNKLTEDTVHVALDAQGQAELLLEVSATSLSGGYQAVPLTIGNETLSVPVYTPEAVKAVLGGLLEHSELDIDAVRNGLAYDRRSGSSFLQQANISTQVMEGALSNTEKLKALLSVFVSFPEGHYLASHVDRLSTFVGETTAPAFESAIISVLGEAIAQRGSSDASDSYKRMLGLLVLSEMLEGYRDMATFLALSVETTEDLERWLNILALPANGWVFFDPPTPRVEQSCTADVIYAFEVEGGEKGMPYNPCRLSGKVFGQWLEGILNEVPDYRNSPSEIHVFLQGLYEGLPSSDYGMRKELFNTSSLPESSISAMDFIVPKAYAAAPAVPGAAAIAAAAARQAAKNFAKNLSKFMIGKSNTRINPLLFAASTVYVNHSVRCDNESAGCNPLVFERTADDKPGEGNPAKQKVNNVMLHLAIGLATGMKRAVVIDEENIGQDAYSCSLLHFTHGYMYEMVSVAYYHALNSAGVGKKIVGWDRRYYVPLYGNRSDKAQLIERRPDIELEGGADDRTQWIELKSVQAGASYRLNGSQLPTREEFEDKFPVMSSKTNLDSQAYHKQFVMDRIAAYGKFRGENIRINERFYWRFHKWKPKFYAATAKRPKLENGFPLHTRIKNTGSVTYLEVIKDIFAKPPADSAFTERMLLVSNKTPPISGNLSKEQMNEIFENPMFDNAGTDIDDYLIDAILKKAGYSDTVVDGLKMASSSIKKYQELQEKWDKYADVLGKLELDFDVDLEELLPDDLRKGAEELGKEFSIDLDMKCDDD